MKPHKFQDDSGKTLDAHFQTQERTLIMLSRSGTIGSPTARNTEYGPALRLLLKRIDRSFLELEGVWVDSKHVSKLPPNEKRIWSPTDSGLSRTEWFTTLSNRMAAVGRDSRSRSRGNTNKRLRFEFAGNHSAKLIERILGWGETDAKPSGRLSPSEKDLVSANHIWHAVERLLPSSSIRHLFHDSTEYDVVADDGTRLPPKAVFSLAATEALGREVDTSDFESDSLIRSIIDKVGFQVVPKNQSLDHVLVPLDSEEREWTEGGRRLVKHYRRERSFRLSQAKKEQFKQDHDGRLHCERCKMDPIEVYGCSSGEACIEVHHKNPLASQPTERVTHLEDLMCVCANCHRIIHRELSNP